MIQPQDAEVGMKVRFSERAIKRIDVVRQDVSRYGNDQPMEVVKFTGTCNCHKVRNGVGLHESWCGAQSIDVRVHTGRIIPTRLVHLEPFPEES
jgi:hypothetical protein